MYGNSRNIYKIVIYPVLSLHLMKHVKLTLLKKSLMLIEFLIIHNTLYI